MLQLNPPGKRSTHVAKADIPDGHCQILPVETFKQPMPSTYPVEVAVAIHDWSKWRTNIRTDEARRRRGAWLDEDRSTACLSAAYHGGVALGAGDDAGIVQLPHRRRCEPKHFQQDLVGMCTKKRCGRGGG